MDPPDKNRRIRFGLRTLLIAVAVCALGIAVYKSWPAREVLPGLRVGATKESALRLLGEPAGTIESGEGWESWNYSTPNILDVGGVVLQIGGGDDRWKKRVSGQSLTVEFQDGKVIDAQIHK